jgi:hypothetical protein
MIPRTDDTRHGCACEWMDDFLIARFSRRCEIVEHRAARRHEIRMRLLVRARRLIGLKP